MASSCTKSFRSSSHLLVSLPALLWVFVDLLSPGFHSAAFLVHPSLPCVAIRWAKACRYITFFCVTTQFVIPYVNIFHQLLSCFFQRIQSSLQDCLHDLLCFLHRRRKKCCCLGRIQHLRFLSLFALFVVATVSSSSFFCFCIFCLYDESKHSALSGAEHLFVFFCCSPCPGSVCNCRCE